ncbi:MAG: hypothetical protein IPJ19_15845 [Planctomycetes bacterium]|nr:hypothetical protein [Planctomycetota bacterium]
MVNTMLMLAQGGAHASWESAPLETWRVVAGALAGLLVLAWVALAASRSARYRAVGVLGPSERERVSAAIAATEKQTSGELVVVVLERSDPHLSARLLAGAALAALVALSCALLFDSVPPLGILGVLAGAALAGFGLASVLPALARAFASEKQATRAAAEQALIEFHTQGLHETADRTGVLVFASLFERRAIVMGDKAVHEKVGDAHWGRARDLVLDAASRGALCEGLVASVAECGRVLAAGFPIQPDDVNELEDRLVVRRE